MANQLRFHPQTADDLLSATARYDEISESLGGRFRDASGIGSEPSLRGRIPSPAFTTNSGPPWCNGFPYVMLFEHSGDCATLLGVFHAASDQSGWFTRSV